jgi:beta-galactosidase
MVAVLVGSWLAAHSAPAENADPRERLSMDTGWKFHFGSLDDAKADFNFGMGRDLVKAARGTATSGANFRDKDWTPVTLPHDWAVGLPFDESADKSHGYKPVGRKYPETSVGWYRRVFDIPASDKGRRICLEFDGVYRDCLVWVNSNLVAHNESGYIGFSCDITDYLNYGGKNAVSVRVDASQPEGWFYEGAGIYRHVWLVKTSPVHVAQWGTYVTSEVNGSKATVTAHALVVNGGDTHAKFDLVSEVRDDAGQPVAEKTVRGVRLDPWEEREITVQVPVRHAKLWSIESPNLYHLATTVQTNGAESDEYETTFGVRTIKFDAEKGFFLNGKHVEIQGMCNHQDHAGIGAALPDRMQDFRVEKLKEMGCNAYRTSHNPPTPELLDACDRLGMLVLDENRAVGSSPEILGELGRMMQRDRNHPSIFMWSLGNEESAIQGTETGARILTTMKREAKVLDPTRPVTIAMNGGWGKGFSDVVDVQGFNYKHQGRIDAFHKDFPAKPSIATEEASTLATRGIYTNDAAAGFMSAYDVNKPGWGSTAEDWWTYYSQRPFLAGAFVWTGFDYRGEPTPYSWPCINSHFGVMDTCGFPKDDFYYYQAWWTDRPVLHLLPHWNWAGREGQEIEVWCFSNCEEVELWLNGQSLGRQKMPRNSHLVWKVKYQPGALVARGYTGGKEIASETVETTGEPAGVRLVPDRATINADGEDVSVVTVQIVDAQGRVVPVADNEVSFDAGPNAKILGVGNGNPSSHEPDKAARRKVFNGLCQVIVQSTADPGTIHLKAESPNLQSAEADIETRAGTPVAAVP